MEVSELFKYRQDILDASKDDDEFIRQEPVLAELLPYMLDAKLVDSEDVTPSYFSPGYDSLKVNAYTVNDSKERLQLFIINDESIDESISEDDLCISLRADYDKQFKKVTKFLNLSIKGDLNNKVQDSDGVVKSLIAKLNSNEGIEQFDVIEIFLLTLTATVSNRGESVQPRKIHFDDEFLKTKFEKNDEIIKKEILILRKVIDLNFIANVIESKGNRAPLTIDFGRDLNSKIEVIQAASEENFESYLCVLDAEVISGLYKKYSSRLLEKNVRSFLQFKGVNRGIKETIRDKPEQFIAFNNGLTITATSAKIASYKKTLYLDSLTDFQIVNGGQTTASIYFSQKEGLDISKVKIMAKINVAKDVNENDLDELISNISKFSNTQSRVSNVDLRSKSPQLRKLKTISDSVITPSGEKWFFERAKGEFLTKVRHAGSNGNRLKNEFPKEHRFTNMELAKYYSAWGASPHLVKKGGEKIFRHFIEKIDPEGNDDRTINIDRVFYEQLIAKIILFRQMEKIYGQGKNSLGQLRAAVIPYVLSILYIYTDASTTDKSFNLDKIWKEEGVDSDLSEYLKALMLLMNDLIKKYSASEDYNEYSKKEELWDSIKSSKEVQKMMNNEVTLSIFQKYTI
ncbi:AIPR family protein [Colwellia sp. 6_MG-2023]|uniref:AIPR family protein n=1 Tax=Colwellia sp. 6_MG-2023 TaxID=3062676 RepID=UPI0026E3FEC4|nr:AIPR family protein [Colwellia sp. 6_MG-2023]MDO6486163.1 AIPR family protein [Colwellia sp. 6_MG-2023]